MCSFVSSSAKRQDSRCVEITQCWADKKKTKQQQIVKPLFVSHLFFSGFCLSTDYRIWKSYSSIFHAGQGVSLFCYDSSATSARRKWSVYDTGRLSNQYVTSHYYICQSVFVIFIFNNFYLCCNMWWRITFICVLVSTALSLFTFSWYLNKWNRNLLTLF